MNIRLTILLAAVCLLGAPIVAQPVIGGGTCNSGSLSGPYEINISGTGGSAPGKIFRAVGIATFDGQGKVAVAMTADMAVPAQTFGVPLQYTATYSVQANCAGTIIGNSATYNIEVHNSGSSLSLIGSDATWVYSGSAVAQAASLVSSCQTSTLSRLFGFAGAGSLLTTSSLGAGINLVGQLTFDGQGNVTANWTQVSSTTTGPVSTTVNASGTYSIGQGCVGSATLTDTNSSQYAVSMSLFTTNPDIVMAFASPISIFSATAFPVSTSATTPVTCSASTLNGTYELSLNEVQVVASQPARLVRGVGTAAFDGQGNVMFTLTADTPAQTQTSGTSVSYTATYSLASNCSGTINLTHGDTGSLTLVAYLINPASPVNAAFQLVGPGQISAYNGAGNVMPSACATSTLSGQWSFSAGATLAPGTAQAVGATILGSVQFDGQGNATAAWSQISDSGATASSFTATGTYNLSSACVGSVTLTDTAANKYSWALVVDGGTPVGFAIAGANQQLILTGNGNTLFTNPGQAVVNAACYAPNSTPAGSVFSVFGSGLTTKVAQASTVPLPTALLSTSVTVNGEFAPLFYADQNQINAQMPEDLQPGIATVIVTNGSASNAVAVTIPSTGTPGIIVYGTNRAVVINANGGVNSPSAPAKVGDTVVVYYTGGGPVTAAGTLVTGAATPSGLSPLSEQNSIRVGGVNSTVSYSGLTPGSIGLYQGNFVVPKVSTGDHPLVIVVGGQSSNNPLIAVTN